MSHPQEQPSLAPTAPPLLDVVLYPHRSLSPTGFGILMGCVAAVSFAAGLLFFLAGAWPVVGFLGLDVLLIYGAFKLSYRAARLTETIALTEQELLVRRVSPRGRVRTWTFQPFWVRVALDEDAGRDSRLVLSSHGRHVELGDFLMHDERVALAKELRGALAPLKAGG
jgi:uncharacterized membrane protein